MKRNIFIVVGILFVLSSQAWAGYQYSAGGTVNGATSHILGGKFMVVGNPLATDGYDGSNWDIQLGQLPYPDPFYVATYKTHSIDGWDGPDGFYTVDARPTLSAEQTITEDFYVWASPSTAVEPIMLTIREGSNNTPFVACVFKMISAPAGIAYNGPTEWTTASSIKLPFYATTDGLTGYHFQAVLTAVPEPSSVLAMFGGLAGIGGLALRRKKAITSIHSV